MSLSRRERGLLNEIGRQLIEAGDVLLTLSGLVVLMLAAVLMSTALGAAGFIIMAAGGTLASRRIGLPRFRWATRPPNPGMRHNTPVQ